MKTKLAVLLAALLLILLFASGCCVLLSNLLPQKPQPTLEQVVETEVPVEKKVSFGDFETTDIYGETFTQELFSDYKLTMVNIWGTFCGPCINEMPELGEIAKEYSEKGVKIVGIVVDATDNSGKIVDSQVELAKELVEKTGAEYTHLLPSVDLIKARLARVSAIPHTLFVDKDGFLVGKAVTGSQSKQEWQKIIDKYLEDVNEGA
ncbi:MAG: Thiol-disulfide oxidoreductase ResA [Firmicutes bacterium ADurb.Bin356]|nr:MAG: Thiol-disulfide oxidoreductase ResA [Firmicutes bacterium ADurb.Bin356]